MLGTEGMVDGQQASMVVGSRTQRMTLDGEGPTVSRINNGTRNASTLPNHTIVKLEYRCFQ